MAKLQQLTDEERADLEDRDGKSDRLLRAEGKALRIIDAQETEIARQAEEIAKLKARAETARREIEARQAVVVEQAALARDQAARLAELEGKLEALQDTSRIIQAVLAAASAPPGTVASLHAWADAERALAEMASLARESVPGLGPR